MNCLSAKIIRVGFPAIAILEGGKGLIEQSISWQSAMGLLVVGIALGFTLADLTVKVSAHAKRSSSVLWSLVEGAILALVICMPFALGLFAQMLGVRFTGVCELLVLSRTHVGVFCIFSFGMFVCDVLRRPRRVVFA